jgi:Zn-dependent peptidase ImmA (M78 family)
MSSQTERRAAEVFDEYLADALRGQQQTADHYLNRCPANEREELQEALDGAGFLLESYYCPQMKKSTVQSLFQELQAMQQKKQVVREARERAAREAAAVHIRDPADYLRGVLNFPPAFLIAQNRPNSAPGYAMLRRGEAPASAAGRWSMDDFQLRVMEKALAPRAEQTLREVMVTEAPIDLRKVADELGLLVQEAPLDDNLDGCLVTDGTVGGILLNRNVQDEHRRRYTLGHEIGHFVLHKDVRVLPETVDEVGSFFLDRIEREANTFSSYLLMPPFLMPKNLGQEPPTLEQGDALVEHFQVSLAAALRRLVRESHWGCALVVTRDGEIQWAVRSQYFEAFIPTGKRPHQNTMAAMLLRTGGPDQDGSKVPAHAWVEGTLAEGDAQVGEQSRRLENGYVYSLLTLMDQE